MGHVFLVFGSSASPATMASLRPVSTASSTCGLYFALGLTMARRVLNLNFWIGQFTVNSRTEIWDLAASPPAHLAYRSEDDCPWDGHQSWECHAACWDSLGFAPRSLHPFTSTYEKRHPAKSPSNIGFHRVWRQGSGAHWSSGLFSRKRPMEIYPWKRLASFKCK